MGVDLDSPVGVDVLLRVQSGPGEVITYVDAADMPRDRLCGLIRVRGEVVAMDTLLLYAVCSLLRWLDEARVVGQLQEGFILRRRTQSIH